MNAKHAATTAIATAAAFACAAGSAHAAVADGVIEHRVYTVHDAAPAAGLPQDLRIEHFVAAGRDRAVITNAATGALVSEVAKDGVVIRDYDAASNVLTTSRAGIPGRNFTLGRADEGANTAGLIGSGTLTVTGATTWKGRAAVTAAFDGAEEHGQRDATYTLDQATKQVLEVVAADGGPAVFERELQLDEDVPATPENAAKLELGDHPGATVVGGAAKASRKAKRAAERSAKRRAAARRLARG